MTKMRCWRWWITERICYTARLIRGIRRANVFNLLPTGKRIIRSRTNWPASAGRSFRRRSGRPAGSRRTRFGAVSAVGNSLSPSTTDAAVHAANAYWLIYTWFYSVAKQCRTPWIMVVVRPRDWPKYFTFGLNTSEKRRKLSCRKRTVRLLHNIEIRIFTLHVKPLLIGPFRSNRERRRLSDVLNAPTQINEATVMRFRANSWFLTEFVSLCTGLVHDGRFYGFSIEQLCSTVILGPKWSNTKIV